MNDSIFVNFIYCGIALYLVNVYRIDIRKFICNESNPKALPGASPASPLLLAASILGAFVLLGMAVIGEYALGLVEAQSELVWYSVFALLAAGIIEELVFRGYLVVRGKGSVVLVMSCLFFSLVFALVHGGFWDTENGFSWNFSTQAYFNSSIWFVNSLCFYALRFGPWNPTQSIIPSIVAHMALNLGVYVVKLSQGFIVF